jgi:oxygen-independent coproporphyrinogen-3 oxidase
LDRAYILTRQERFHREVVNSIMCQESLDLDTIGTGEGFTSREVRDMLQAGIDRIPDFVSDGLCTFDGAKLHAVGAGRFAVRNIAFLFDPLIGTGEGRYSRTV